MDAKLIRIRELIDQKEAIDTELASLIGDTQAPRRGRPRKADTGTSRGDAMTAGPASGSAPSE
jgi:hypothetical protein